MSLTRETCGVCDKIGLYDHENDEDGDMTLLCCDFDYIHWGCFDKAMRMREGIYDFDVWLYPEQLERDMVLNVFRDEEDIQTNEYKLPENWKEIVTQDGGKDGKKSIHDIMIAI